MKRKQERQHLSTLSDGAFGTHKPNAFPSKTWFWGIVWDGLSGRCRDGLTLERCSQLAAFAIHPVG